MEKTDTTLHSQEIPNWWVLKPVNSVKSLADLLFVPTSLMRKIDWSKARNVFESENQKIWPLYTLIGVGELARGAIYGLAIKNSVPLYIEIAKSVY